MALTWGEGEMPTDNHASHIKPICNAGALTGLNSTQEG